jgi:hypothetical protein
MKLDETRVDVPTNAELGVVPTNSQEAVPPLTSKSSGAVYARLPAVEAQIREVLSLPGEDVLRRAAIRDAKNPDYIASECLIHLVRRKLRDPHSRRDGRLLKVLLDRAAKDITPRGFEMAALDEIRQATLSELCERLLSDSESINFFEARYALALKTLAIDAARQYRKRTDAVGAIDGLKDSQESDDEMPEFRSEEGQYIVGREVSQENTVFLHQLLDRLSPKERKAVQLVHWLGMKEASNDPNEHTAASIMKVSDRTVRNLLRSAQKKAYELTKEFV